MLEEGIGVLGHTAHNRFLGVQSAGAELGQSLLVDERSQVFVVESFDFLNLVRSTETVEEVDKRYTRERIVDK